MSRVRKPLSTQKGDLTVLRREKMELEENLLKQADRSQVLTPPEDLEDPVAREMWQFVVDVKTEMGMLTNGDYANMYAYCVAWSNFKKSLRYLDEDAADILLIGMKMQKQASDELYRYGARLGLDLNGQLKVAAAKVEKEQQHVEARFGVI